MQIKSIIKELPAVLMKQYPGRTFFTIILVEKDEQMKFYKYIAIESLSKIHFSVREYFYHYETDKEFSTTGSEGYFSTYKEAIDHLITKLYLRGCGEVY